MLAEITCGKDVTSTFHAVEFQMAKMCDATMNKDPEEPFQMLPDLVHQIRDLLKVIRADLGVDPPASLTFRSSGSSGAYGSHR